MGISRMQMGSIIYWITFPRHKVITTNVSGIVKPVKWGNSNAWFDVNMFVPNCDLICDKLRKTVFANAEVWKRVCADYFTQIGALRLQLMKLKHLCGIKKLWLHGCPNKFWNNCLESSTTAITLLILNEYSKWWKRSSLVSIETGIRAVRPENRGSILDETVGILIFASMSRPELWVNPVSYPMGTQSLSLEDKASGALQCSLTSIFSRWLRNIELYVDRRAKNHSEL